MPVFTFEGTAKWKSGTECDLSIKGKHIITVSPPPEFGGKQGYCVPEEIFAVSLASCMNTIFLLIAKNSQLSLKNLETKTTVKMDAESLEKLIFTHIHFDMKIKLEKDDEWNRKKANTVFKKTEKNMPTSTIMGRKGPNNLQANLSVGLRQT